MKNRRHFIKFRLAAVLAGAMSLTVLPSFAQPAQFLNVSYDPTRELYAEFNPDFPTRVMPRKKKGSSRICVEPSALAIKTAVTSEA